MSNIGRELESQDQSQVGQFRCGVGQDVATSGTRKSKANKSSVRSKRTMKNRKRNREGLLTGQSQDSDSACLYRINMDNVLTNSDVGSTCSYESGNVEVIDVEKLKDLPLVDLTEDTSNDVFVDLTRDLPSSPQAPRVLNSQSSVICLSPSNNGQCDTPLLQHNRKKDDILLINNDSESGGTSPEPTKSVITCAICMDNYDQIKKGKRQLTSTHCGHVFCNTCIDSALRTQAKCPTCRKKVTRKQLHPIFL